MGGLTGVVIVILCSIFVKFMCRIMQHHRFKIQCFSLFLAVFMAGGLINISKSMAQEAQEIQAEQSPAGSQTQNPAQGSAYAVTGLPIPRFVSLASDKIFMRTGPGQKYPLMWEYNRKNLPVEIILEFDVWRKIRDYEGSEGWVHKSLLSGKRFVMVRAEEPVPLLRKPEAESRKMAMIGNNALAALESCEGDWCEIKAQGYSGWLQRKFLWGVYDAEQFN